MKVKLLFPLFVFFVSLFTFSQTINQPTDLLACDDNNDGVAEFDLESQTLPILGNLSLSDYEVTYYETLQDAQNNVNPLISPYSNVVNPQVIYARAEELSTGNFQMTSFNLIIEEFPTTILQDYYEFCEGSTLVVDSGVQSQDYEFVWYLDGIVLVNETNSSLMVTQPGSYSLQLISNFGNCSSFNNFYVFITTFDNVVDQTEYIVCDNDNDGIYNFNLDELSPEIQGGNQNPNLLVTYHLSQAEADGFFNALDPIFTNTIPFAQTLYARVSLNTGDCFTTTILNLVVDVNCVSASSVEAFICGEDPNIPVAYDLTSHETEILNGQNSSDFIISYYISETNAVAEVNPISNPQAYNVDGNSEIYVRIENQSGSYTVVVIFINFYLNPIIDFYGPFTICGGNELLLEPYLSNNNGAYEYIWSTGSTNAEIVVFEGGTYTVTVTDLISGCMSSASVDVIEGNDAPILGNATDLLSCGSNPSFDLTTTLPEILNGQDESQFEIGFFSWYNDAFSNSNQITNPTNYVLANGNETIFVRVQNGADECFSISNFNLVIDNSCPVIVDCEDEVNTTYCYSNNDTSEFYFESLDGLPLTLIFNAGATEVDFDVITIIDSDGSVMNADLPYGNDGDFTGLTYTSTGSSITVKFNSDSTVSCVNGNTCCTEQFDFDVLCASSVGFIQVNAFVDANANNIYDANEFSFSNGYFTYEVNGDGILNTINSSTGHFLIISANETDVFDITFNLYDESEACYDITTAGFDNISVATGSTVTIDFPVVEEQSCEDLAVYLLNYWTPPRPGFAHENHLVLENLGFTTISSGTVEFTYDPLLVYNGVTNVNPNYTITNTATGFTVDFVNLQPGDVAYIDISLTCPVTVELGDIVTNTATYITDTSDLVASNNYSTLSELVVGSWDPNDKMESHGPRVVFDDFATSDEWLYYTVRFQNLGTFPATFVRIEDELDAQLDETTFQMLRSSHDYVVTRTANSLEWFFEDINLPAEQDDAEGSNGYVYFRIKPKAGYALGDIIPNTAAIFFDFNAPVITNTFETEFVDDPLSVSEYDFNGFNMYPNPAKDVLTIKLNNISSANLSIYDIQGKLIKERTISNEQNLELSVSDLQSGMYFVKLNTATKEMVKKLIIE